MTFADRLIAACRQRESRLVVGLDPHWGLIPASFKAEFTAAEPGEIIAEYCLQVIDATSCHAAAFKPQIAFFEQFGTAGMQALDRVLTRIRTLGGLVLLDAKRGDIGTTAEAYAHAFFGGGQQPAPWPADALTVNAYLGSDGVRPFLTNPDRGIFVLVKTSNPSSGELQDLRLASGETVAEHMADVVASWNAPTVGASGYGNVGAVIGATYPEAMKTLRGRMPQSLILVPGYGAQGGDEAAVRAAFNGDGLGALINSSRGIMFPPDYAADGFKAVARAAGQAREHIQSLIA